MLVSRWPGPMLATPSPAPPGPGRGRPGRGAHGRVLRHRDRHRGALRRRPGPHRPSDDGGHRPVQQRAGRRPVPVPRPPGRQLRASLPTPSRWRWPRSAPGSAGVTAARAGRHPAPAGRPGPAVRAEHAEPADRHPGRRPQNDVRQGQVSIDLPISLWGQLDTLVKQPFLDDLARWFGTGMRLVDFRSDPGAAAHRGQQLDAGPELVPVPRPRRRRAGHRGHATADDRGHVHRRAVGPTLRRQPHAPDDLPPARRQHDGRDHDEHHEPRGSGLRPRQGLAGGDAARTSVASWPWS